jgi:hypothetical protein
MKGAVKIKQMMRVPSRLSRPDRVNLGIWIALPDVYNDKAYHNQSISLSPSFNALALKTKARLKKQTAKTPKASKNLFLNLFLSGLSGLRGSVF